MLNPLHEESSVTVRVTTASLGVVTLTVEKGFAGLVDATSTVEVTTPSLGDVTMTVAVAV